MQSREIMGEFLQMFFHDLGLDLGRKGHPKPVKARKDPLVLN